MSREQIIQKIDQILIEGFEVEPGQLQPGARLAEDLELDSLDGVDLVVAIEKAFDCRIEESEARSMRKMQDLYDYVRQSVGAVEDARK
ncbi:MAG: acyl carrier protein [bacterium]